MSIAVQAETHINASQAQVWEVLGNIARLKEWICSDSSYMPPAAIEGVTEIEGVPQHFRLFTADGQKATFKVARYEPGIALELWLTKLEGSELDVHLYGHKLYMALQENNTTYVFYEIELELKPVESRLLNFIRWRLHLNIRNEQLEDMAHRSLWRLKQLVESSNQDDEDEE